MDRDSDALYDTSEPAMRNRIERFKRRIVESPIDRACQAAIMTVEDINAAIHTAQSPAELAQVRVVVEETINQLIVSSTVALTLAEYWDQGKR